MVFDINAVAKRREGEKATDYDKGFIDALNAVISETQSQCFRSRKNCNNCVNTDMTCITYRRVARVYELFERGRI